MSGALIVSDQKHDVLTRIDRGRRDVAAEARLLMQSLNPIVKLRRGVLSIVDHPLLWMMSAGLIVFSIGPNRIMRVLLSAWHALQIFRFFKKKGIWSH